MKPITNILLIIYIIAYTFLPIFDVSLVGGQTGFDYTAYTISNSDELLKQIFSLLPFIVAFAAISFNCMKNRFWGIAVAIIICFGLYFYVDAKDFVLIQKPEFFKIESLGVGFYVGYASLLLSLISAAISVLPFKFNKLHARENTLFAHKNKQHMHTESEEDGKK